MRTNVYSEDFYEETTAGGLSAARAILPLLWQKRAFTTVVDVGCGLGAWLLAAQELGAQHLIGFDGEYVPKERMVIDPSTIEFRDLTNPIRSNVSYELCLCLEVAEHLPASRAE